MANPSGTKAQRTREEGLLEAIVAAAVGLSYHARARVACALHTYQEVGELGLKPVAEEKKEPIKIRLPRHRTEVSV